MSGSPAIKIVPPAAEASEPSGAAYLEFVRVLDRMHRRYQDVVRMDLVRFGADDISATQAMMLAIIGTGEPSVREVVERGYYLGSNASYNLKHLIEAGYVDRGTSPRDKRSAKLRLSEKGLALIAQIREADLARGRSLASNPEGKADLEASVRVVRRMERLWTDTVRFQDPPGDY